MDREELIALLRLQATKAVGPVLAKKMIETIGAPQQIFKEKAENLQKIKGLGSFLIHQIQDASVLNAVEKEYERIQQFNINCISFLDVDYPKLLKHCADAPILFFKEGNINFSSDKFISIVGTRQMTSYGKQFCEKLIEELAIYNPTIVSGFAYGVDICAHQAAIKNNLQTIGVLAHGFGQIYPKTHKKHMASVMEKGGFLSEFWYDENPLRENFLKRNRIVAGLSKATVIIESASKGGSLVTADIANTYNRDVFALPGKHTDVYSAGCNSLIKRNKAALITSSQDIIEMLNWDVATPAKKVIQKELFVTLTKEEEKIYKCLEKQDAVHIDILAKKCEIPVYRLASILLQMELKDVVKPLPGKLFEGM